MDKRTTLALLLMAALLMIYPAIFMRSEPEKKPDQKTEAPRPCPEGPDAAPTAGDREPSRHRCRRRTRRACPDRTATIESAALSRRGEQSRRADSAWELHYRGAKPMVAPGFLPRED